MQSVTHLPARVTAARESALDRVDRAPSLLMLDLCGGHTFHACIDEQAARQGCLQVTNSRTCHVAPPGHSFKQHWARHGLALYTHIHKAGMPHTTCPMQCTCVT
jgi:hypothetical protein